MRNIKLIGLGTLFVAAVIIIWGLAANQGSAQGMQRRSGSNCNVQNLGGTYIFAAFGEMLPGNPNNYPVGPYNSVATIVLDGAGNYTATAKTMYNGGPAVDESREGTYAVVDGCAVVFSVTGSGDAVYAVFTQDRSEGRGVLIIPGTNVTILYARK